MLISNSQIGQTVIKEIMGWEGRTFVEGMEKGDAEGVGGGLVDD